MKVESSPDVHILQRLDQPGVGQPTAPSPVRATDELVQLFGQEVALNNRTLQQRALGVRVPATERLAQLYDQLGHPAQASLASMARRVRLQLLQQPSIDTLLDLTGSDPARTFVVLKQVAAQAQAESRKIEAALARDAIAKLELRFKREIQAGLNIAIALQANGADPQERQALRALYYASVVRRQSLATMMQALLGVYGDEGFAAGLQLIRRALADDIAAHVSSIPTAMLRTLLMGLQSCGQLSAVLSGCRELIQRLGIEHDAVVLLQRLLGYASSGIAADEILRLGDDLVSGLSIEVLVCLNACYQMFRQMPANLWPDSRVHREAMICFVAVLDELARIERGPSRFVNGGT